MKKNAAKKSSHTLARRQVFRKNELMHAYLAANEDIGQQEAMKEWKQTIQDGSSE